MCVIILIRYNIEKKHRLHSIQAQLAARYAPAPVRSG
jgi:hypothetical protein